MNSVTKQHIDYFVENGYVLFPKLLEDSAVDAIRMKSKEIFARQIANAGVDLDINDEQQFEKELYKLFQQDYDAFIGAAKLCQHQIELHQLAVSDTIIETIKQLGVKDPSICVKPIVYFNSRFIAKLEGHYKTPSHQDWRSMQGSVNSVVVWIPLIDIDKELGALEVIPGTHIEGLYETEKDEWFRTIKDERVDENNFVSLEVQKGDLVCFNSFLVHRSGNNTSDHIRWSMHFRYNDMDEATFIDRKNPHPYIVYTPNQDLLFPEFHPEVSLKKHFNEIQEST